MTVLNPTSAPAMPSVSRMAPSLYGNGRPDLD
jgi:hypothetical protein